jgi:hypothetical protein
MCDCEHPAVYDECIAHSRRERPCEECWVPIVHGERYVAVSGLWDREWRRYAFCLFCQALRREAERDGEGDCICFGGLRDAMGGGWIRHDEDVLLDQLFPHVAKETPWQAGLGPSNPSFWKISASPNSPTRLFVFSSRLS